MARNRPMNPAERREWSRIASEADDYYRRSGMSGEEANNLAWETAWDWIEARTPCRRPR